MKVSTDGFGLRKDRLDEEALLIFPVIFVTATHLPIFCVDKLKFEKVLGRIEPYRHRF